MSSLHPVFVHFPVALLTVSFAFELLSLARRSEEFSRFAWWLHMLGTAGVLLSVATGLAARAGSMLPPAAIPTAENHEQLALLVAATMSVLVMWRIGTRTTLPARGRWAYIAGFGVGVVLMWVGAWYGGELVYRYGVGIAVP